MVSLVAGLAFSFFDCFPLFSFRDTLCQSGNQPPSNLVCSYHNHPGIADGDFFFFFFVCSGPLIVIRRLDQALDDERVSDDSAFLGHGGNLLFDLCIYFGFRITDRFWEQERENRLGKYGSGAIRHEAHGRKGNAAT